MLTDGVNHVAVLTNDTERLHAFYVEVFGAEVRATSLAGPEGDGFRLSIVDVGPHSELNVFEIDGNSEAERQVPMFGRGRIDHLALQAGSLAEFETIATGSWPGAPPTGSSPTSGRSSACSSGTRTASSARSAWRTRTRCPACTTRRARLPRATQPRSDGPERGGAVKGAGFAPIPRG